MTVSNEPEETFQDPQDPQDNMADQNTQAIIDAVTNGITQLQNAITTAITNASAPPPPGPFLRTPLQAKVNDTIDFNSKEGRQYHETATKSLFPDGEKFDVEPSKFQTFMNLLLTRLRDLGMFQLNKNCMIPLAGNQINMVTDYGRVTLTDVATHVATFITTNTRNSQNSKILFDLLNNSCSTDGLRRVQLWHSQYEVLGQQSGECFLKIIVRESYLDSNATVATMRLNLTNLDEYMTTNGSDIVAFNAYVQSQIDGLAARGEVTSDLLVNLFKGYKMVKDRPFLDYLQTIENGHEDGSAVVDAPNLMLRAVNFYKNRLTCKQWEQKSQQERDVLALEAKVEQLQKNVRRKAKQAQGSPMKLTGQATRQSKDVKKDQKPVKPDWLLKHTPPKPNAIKRYREWNGTKWYWCCKENGGKCGGAWRAHLPSQCKGYSKQGKSKNPKLPPKKDTTGTKRKSDALKLSAVNKAIVEATQWENDEHQEQEYILDDEYHASEYIQDEDEQES